MLKAIRLIKYFLITSSVFLLFSLLSVKFILYKQKINIRGIEKEIALLHQENNVLETELAFLTNPTRLQAIYKDLQNLPQIEVVANLTKQTKVSVNQIKNINRLKEYYLAKSKSLQKNKSFATSKNDKDR